MRGRRPRGIRSDKPLRSREFFGEERLSAEVVELGRARQEIANAPAASAVAIDASWCPPSQASPSLAASDISSDIALAKSENNGKQTKESEKLAASNGLISWRLAKFLRIFADCLPESHSPIPPVYSHISIALSRNGKSGELLVCQAGGAAIEKRARPHDGGPLSPGASSGVHRIGRAALLTAWL